MVYFTCNACGEQVKKPAVEKHYTQKCRACNVLTCIDCLKDFVGDDYKGHTTCMSEEQRYSKEGRSGWDPTVGQGNKGEKRQNQWTSNLRRILAEATDLDQDVRTILDTIQEHDNIPRKKPKFVNFVKNIMRNRARPHSIDKTWELFEQALRPPPEAAPMEVQETEESAEKKEEVVNGKENVNGEQEEEQKLTKKKKKKRDRELEDKMEEDEPQKGKKRKLSEDEDGADEQKLSKKKKKKRDKELAEKNDNEPKNGKKLSDEDNNETAKAVSPVRKATFDWDDLISACLKQKEGNEMKLVKLKKKCVHEYFAAHEGTHRSKEEVGAKFDKRLKKRCYRQLKDRVRLVEGEEDSDGGEQGPAAKPAERGAKPAISFNKWEGADMGSDAKTEKFRRLMGIKAAPKPAEVAGGMGRDTGKMLRDLEKGFEKARETHFGGRSFTM